MKLKKIAAVVATMVAGQAFALDLATDVPDVEFQISGATAADKQVQTYYSSLCDISTQTNYNDVAQSDEAIAIFCTVRAANPNSPFAVDKDVLFRKENGGSSTGVAPVSTAGTVLALDASTCSETLAPTATTAGEGTCSNTKIQLPAQVGISDVEPELFVIPANGAKTVDLTAPMSVFPVNAQTFGIVVSPGLRDALQDAQGLDDGLPAGDPGRDEVQRMPSMSSDLIANIFASNVKDWSELKGLGGIAITAGKGLSNEAVNVCVRTPGSGTQAQFNALFMGNACSYRGADPSIPFLGKVTADDCDGIENNSTVCSFFGSPLPGPHVHKNKGSSDMGKCITNINADGRWAIGIQSLEKVDEGRTNRNDFKYVAIDGVTPILENVAAGLYFDVAALTIQYRTDVVTAGSDARLLADALVNIARNLNDIKDFNTSLQTDDASTSNDDRPGPGLFNTPEILLPGGAAAANVGSLAFADGAVQPSFPFAAANPVYPFNQGLTGPSSCAVPTYNAVGIDVTQKN